MLTALQKAKLLKKHPDSLGAFMLLEKFHQEYKKEAESLLMEFGQRLEGMQQEAMETFTSVRKMQKGEKGDRGETGRDGLDGKDSSVVGPRGLVGERGPAGKDGRDGISGRDGKNGIDGRNGIDGISPDKNEVATLVYNLIKENKLSVDDIEGLRNILNTIIRNQAELRGRSKQVGGGGGGGGGMGNWEHEVHDTSSATTTITLASRIAAAGSALILRYQGQVLAHGVQYTVGGDYKTITFTFTLQDNTFVEVSYVRS